MVHLSDLGIKLTRFDNQTILVTDALGVIGHRVVGGLLAAGHPNVRIGVPDVTKVEHFKQHEGAEIVQFEFDKPETYMRALHQVDTVYLAMPDHEEWQENLESFLNAMNEEKVSNIVKLSICHSFISKHDPFSKVPIVKMHREADDRIVQFTKNYTIIMASHFMSNPTVYQQDLLRKEHRFIGASASKGVAYVSPNDVADVAVKALLNPNEFKKKTIHLTGADVIKDKEIAEMLSDALGTHITFEDKALEQFHEEAKATDWGTAADVVLLERVKGTGYEEHGFVSNDVEKICGHRAETYKDYLNNRASMTPKELGLFLKA
mmetsp:Transcript_7747/g.15025  ORF Transcript_7747/g.15025 Transcript_7747/m.15025 type:complete len:320 (-) Transcript_7747:994-1953(-)|eukprot:scaffold4425_cov168-Amphora_coffeaeformis.AAC.6